MDRAAIHALLAHHRLPLVRIARVAGTPHFDAYRHFVAQGRQGQMHWMRELSPRVDPRERMPSARSALVLRVEYAHQLPPDPGGLTGRVARYAWGRDYHNLIGKRLQKVRRDLRAHGIASWGGVDTAPIVERAWAAAAGAGFAGKNCMQIVPGRTSWMFLAVLFVDLELEPDPPRGDHCGKCTRCLSACPTSAFEGPRSLDARRCIAYWTIEARGLPPRDLRAGFGRWFFGCDVCQEVCPHNHNPPEPDELDFAGPNAFIELPELLRSPDESLMERFLGTPIRRPKAHGLKRNALMVLANLGDTSAIPLVREQLQHPHPDVRAAAVWAAGRLGDRAVLDHIDPDPAVHGEVVALRRDDLR